MAFAEPMNRKKPAQPVDRYLGVDPGLNCTGYALLERTSRGPVLREGGVVRSTRSDSLAQRVMEIAHGIREIIEEYQPQLMAVEKVFSHGKNVQTALLMAHARGAILLVAAEQKVPVLHYTPTHIKKLLTGSGRASKEQIQFAIRNELGLENILEPNDVADASAVALCLYHSVRHAV
jgi:crossover junction endodeoxyribonuclease RuvC